jgi:hypothetical protein
MYHYDRDQHYDQYHDYIVADNDDEQRLPNADPALRHTERRLRVRPDVLDALRARLRGAVLRRRARAHGR